ncbi:hypothetical protein D3C86_1313470 [compost metagenome]
MYNHEEVNTLPKITLKIKDQSLENVLEQLLAGSGLKFTVRSNSIVIGPKQERDGNTGSRKISISGQVIDENKQPLPRATVSESGASNGALTDDNGRFQLKVAENAVLEVSYLGMEGQHIPVGGKTSFKIVMKLKDMSINEVVVTV